MWGPFSPIYGAGAVVLTVSLNRFYHSHNLVIFLTAMVVGSAIEYATSWGMEYFWGAVAWNYDGTFGSIDGTHELRVRRHVGHAGAGVGAHASSRPSSASSRTSTRSRRSPAW